MPHSLIIYLLRPHITHILHYFSVKLYNESDENQILTHYPCHRNPAGTELRWKCIYFSFSLEYNEAFLYISYIASWEEILMLSGLRCAPCMKDIKGNATFVLSFCFVRCLARVLWQSRIYILTQISRLNTWELTTVWYETNEVGLDSLLVPLWWSRIWINKSNYVHL